MYPGVAQLVARLLWEQDAVGSSPATRTKILTESRVYSPLSVIFYAYLCVLLPLSKKSHFYGHIIKCGLKNFLIVYSNANFERFI